MYLILGDGDGASSIATNSFFGSGTGTMWINNVTCGVRRRERRLLECNHQVNQRCTHADDAGVRCMEGGVSLSYIANYRLPVHSTS